MPDVAQVYGGPTYEPLVLYAETELPTGAGAAPNAGALTNPYGVPMEILEMRFSIYATEVTLGETGSVTGTAVGVKLDLGNLGLSNPGVTISTLGGFRTESNSTFALAAGTSFLTTARVYTWRLKYPLYVPVGATVVPTFTNLGQVGSPVKVRVSYHCRSITNSWRPQKLIVPWVSTYNSTTFEVIQEGAGAATDASTETGIFNQFDVPLEISKLVGRWGMLSKYGGASDKVFEFANPDQALKYTTIEIRSSKGEEIIRDPTLFGLVFTPGSNTWDFKGNWQLDPHEWWKVQVTHNALDYTPDAALLGRVQFSMSLIGYREVKAGAL